MSELVSFTRHGNIGVITIENPPVNALSPGVPEGIIACIEAVRKDREIRGLILIGSGRTFIAGADIREFEKIVAGEKSTFTLQPMLQAIEDCPKAIVVAIHGTAFGGGLETAMAGHYRVASPTAQVGQPEVKLGIIPGAGGTQRLPRLAGVAKAVEMCAFGEPIDAKAALEAGIIDKIIEGDLLTGALEFARGVAGRLAYKTRERGEKLRDTSRNSTIFSVAREHSKKTRRGQTAPLAAIDAVEASTRLSFDDGIRREAELFRQCLFGSQSKALIHAFFGERTVSKIPDIPKETPVYPIRRAAVIGAGTMGGGIAMNFANAGIPVIVKETSQAALDQGMATIRKNYENSVKKGRFTPDVMARRLSLITPQLATQGLEQADLIVEAVFEELLLKEKIFAELDKIAKPECILATNTSTLDVDRIAAATARPQMVVGLHFFSPANVMRLLEVVRGKATSKEVIATSMALARKLGKVGVLAGNGGGFIGNRMLMKYLREAQLLVEEGAAVEAVDAALYEFGMAMGPFAMIDMAGLDVAWRIRKEHKHLEKPGERYPLVEDLLCNLGRFGQKTGAGWYKYDAERNPTPDPDVAALIEKTAREAGIVRRAIGAEEIIERTIYALVNEGARILEEGIALRAVDIDVVYLTGYGFPAWRGGPMFYADTVGLPEVLAKVEQFRWQPAPLLKKLKTFQAANQ